MNGIRISGKHGQRIMWMSTYRDGESSAIGRLFAGYLFPRTEQTGLVRHKARFGYCSIQTLLVLLRCAYPLGLVGGEGKSHQQQSNTHYYHYPPIQSHCSLPSCCWGCCNGIVTMGIRFSSEALVPFKSSSPVGYTFHAPSIYSPPDGDDLE